MSGVVYAAARPATVEGVRVVVLPSNAAILGGTQHVADGVAELPTRRLL
jgi:hypothetical protein